MELKIGPPRAALFQQNIHIAVDCEAPFRVVLWLWGMRSHDDFWSWRPSCGKDGTRARVEAKRDLVHWVYIEVFFN